MAQALNLATRLGRISMSGRGEQEALYIVGGFSTFDFSIVVEHEVPEVKRVDVLGQQVEEEPVANTELVDDGLQSFSVGHSASRLRRQDSNARDHNGECAIDDGHERSDGKEVEPEPQEDVNLLVNDVDGQDAHSVVSLHISG